MGMLIRDDRQMKAVTGLSQAQFNSLLPAFSDIYQAARQKTYKDGVKPSTCRCNPGRGCSGTCFFLIEEQLYFLYSPRHFLCMFHSV